MKSSKGVLLLTLIFLFHSFSTIAQSFEGVITYSIDYEVVQEDRMDLEIYKAMVPQKIELSLKGHHSLLKFVGGMTQGFLGDILYNSKEKMLYSIIHANQTVLQIPVESLTNKVDVSVFKAVKTAETMQILGYNCTKYIVKDEKAGTETTLWSTTSFTSASANVMSYVLESMTQLGVTGLEGFPLKIQFRGKEFDLTLLAESKESKTLPSHLFEIPKHYKITKAN